MKLFSQPLPTSPTVRTAPVDAIQPDTHQHGHQVTDGPVTILVVAVTPITFKDAKLPVRRLRVNSRVRAWMDHDTGVENWVNTCLATFASVPTLLSLTCPVPDQYRDDMGDAIHLERFKDDEIRVMA